MKNLFCILAFLAYLSACRSGHNGHQATTDSTSSSITDTGWTCLSCSNSLEGWHSYGKPVAGSAWETDSGTIHLRPGARAGYQTAGGGDLVTDSSYDNFHLKLEWKVGYGANSGIILFVQEDTAKYKETWNTGIEMQVCDKDNNEDAHSPKHEAGELYDLVPATARVAKPYGEWNQAEIISNNGKLDLLLNGTNIISTTLWDDHWQQLIAGSKFRDMPGFGTFTKGRIALQDHGEEVWYRNIMIKKL